MIDRLRALPGVEGVADASVVPLSGYGWQENVILAGSTKRADVAPLFTQVSPDFFNTMGIRIMAGRAFSERDTANSLKVAIVNQSFVKKNPQRRQSHWRALSNHVSILHLLVRHIGRAAIKL